MALINILSYVLFVYPFWQFQSFTDHCSLRKNGLNWDFMYLYFMMALVCIVLTERNSFKLFKYCI